MATADENTDGLNLTAQGWFMRLRLAKFTSISRRRILNLMCNVHHVIYLALLIYTFDKTIGLAIVCYGAVICLILVVQRTTRDRNIRFGFFDELQER